MRRTGQRIFWYRDLPEPGRSSSERKPLTPRERSVLQLIAEGYTSKQVARRLGISQNTVETYRHSLRSKLELSTTAALARYAIRHGLASLGP